MPTNQSSPANEEGANRGRITFTVYGHPRSKGSAHAFVVNGKNGGKPRAIVTQAPSGEAGKNLRNWEQLIGTAAQQFAEEGRFFPKGTPVEVMFWFYFTRPQSKKARTPMVVQPDWDKLSRAVCDAMQKVLFQDDCQITTAHVYKRHTAGASHVKIALQQDWAACDESSEVATDGLDGQSAGWFSHGS